MEKVTVTQARRIRNGGFVQGLLEMAEECGCLSAEDKIRLDYLRSLPQNRTEIISVHEFKEVICK